MSKDSQPKSYWARSAMDQSRMLERCQDLAACLTISCFGMLSFASEDFLAEYKNEILPIWHGRELRLNEDMFLIGFEKLVRALDSSEPYAPDDFFHQQYFDSYLSGDDGSFDSRVGRLINDASDLAMIADSLLSGADITKTVGSLKPIVLSIGRTIEATQGILCYALFNTSEPEDSHARDEFNASPCWPQVKRDLQYAIELAEKEKFVPRGERKWDYDFFGLSKKQ